jgi:hypothetical protein
MRGSPEFPEGLPVRPRGVTFVLVPLVLGKFLVQIYHQGIPGRFGQNRSGSNIQEPCIPFDEAMVGNIPVGLKAVAIHGNGCWLPG